MSWDLILQYAQAAGTWVLVVLGYLLLERIHDLIDTLEDRK